MKYIFLLLPLALLTAPAYPQDTFSIVAVDTITGEVGSAGASCLDDVTFPGSGGAIIISDLLPGRGAIHTQASWNPANQANARLKMEEGLAPADILLWLKNNDVGGVFGAVQRQYGIVDFDPQGHPRSAASTGVSCLDWKGHKTGLTYSIQGNILLGPQILDSMEARFLNSSGPLADRLMAALQGAKVIGADTRCTANGTSSLSAFLRVAKPGDAPDSLYLDLNVPALPAGREPIDSLQTRYDAWKLTGTAEPSGVFSRLIPNPASGAFDLVIDEPAGRIEMFDLTGRPVYREIFFSEKRRFSPPLPPGVYLVRIIAGNSRASTKKLVWLGQ